MKRELGLAANIAEAANFATYFTANPPASSTPHLYISALATWSTGSTISQQWREKFPHIPSYIHRKTSDVPLMAIQTNTCILSAAFSSDGTRIVSGSEDKSVRVWDASTGAELKVLNGHTGYVYSTAFSSDGTCIVSGSSDKSVRVWDASTGAELKVLNGHTEAVWSAAFSSDGTRIVSGSSDKSVRVWDVSTGAELKVLNGHTGYVI
jgi:WD40 repeat protein